MSKLEVLTSSQRVASDIINEVGLGQVGTVGSDGEPDVTPMPFEAVYSETTASHLLFHLPRKHATHQENLLAGRTTVASFIGPQGYISPRWYEQPLAPTWNFEFVKVRGVAEELTSDETIDHLRRLTDRHEGEAEGAFSLKDADPDYLNGLLSAIRGFRLPMSEVEVKLKLSQNRTPEELETIQEGLLARGLPMDTWLARSINLHNATG